MPKPRWLLCARCLPRGRGQREATLKKKSEEAGFPLSSHWFHRLGQDRRETRTQRQRPVWGGHSRRLSLEGPAAMRPCSAWGWPKARRPQLGFRSCSTSYFQMLCLFHASKPEGNPVWGVNRPQATPPPPARLGPGSCTVRPSS